jgi:DNA-binding XRE family transcriptional regulator
LKARITEILKTRGKSKGWLSQVTGINRQHIARLCNDRTRDPRLSTAYLISKALGWPVEEIWPKSEGK